MGRRAFLTVGAVGLSGATLHNVVRAAEAGRSARAKHVIFLHQFGGPSHLDTFDMKPDAPEGIRGTFSSIATSVPGYRMTEHLPRWARLMDRCVVVRSVHHDMKNHNSAGYYSLTGHRPPVDDQRLRDSLELYPGFGSVVAKLRPVADPAIPSYVSYPYVIADGSVTPGQRASFLGKEHDPFYIGENPASPNFRLPELSLPARLANRLDDRRKLLDVIDRQGQMLEWSALAQGIDQFYERAVRMLLSPTVKQAFDLSRESAAVRDAYGRNAYGQSCLLARRLVEAGVRFVTVYFSRSIGGAGSEGWDTHQNNFEDLKNRLLPITDRTVPTLIEDLEARGLLKETLVLWMGEFGRAPKIGDRDGKGRAHWPGCYSVVMAGGGLRGGTIFGSSDRIGAYPGSEPTRPDDIAATMYEALGIDPHAEVHDTLNRPLAISTGSPIYSLFA
jgi:hypothetical protein